MPNYEIPFSAISRLGYLLSLHDAPVNTDTCFNEYLAIGTTQVLRNTDGGGGCLIFLKKRYEGVMFNVISVTRGWVGVQFPEK